jgi:hypothetical protein
MERFDELLSFGADVSAGLRTVAPDAGPPDKILAYLQSLADVTEARRKGPLGTSPILWLADRGLSVSGESPTIRKFA